MHEETGISETLMQPLDTVHAPLLSHFPEVVRACGGDPDRLLRQAAFAPGGSGLDVASYRQIVIVLETAATSLGRPDFGMMLASRQCRDGIEGPLGKVMRFARCFGDVLELAVRHGYAHSLASHTWLHRSRSNPPVLFGHDILLEGTPSTVQVMEQILLVGHLTAIRLTGGAVRARRILLRHRPASPSSVYRRYFGCEVRFDQRVNATAYSEQDLSRPILSADPHTFRQGLAALHGQFQEKQLPLSRIARGAILHHLDDGGCTGEWLAARLGLHPRTLHRRLHDEGTSFRRIKDAMRRDLAEYYLRHTDIEVKAISERLGFAEQSAFSRGCRRWFDASPSGLRAGADARG